MGGYGGKWVIVSVRDGRERPLQVIWMWRWRRVSSASYATWQQVMAAEPHIADAWIVRVKHR